MRFYLCAALAITAIVSPSSAFAWSATGHHVVAVVAYEAMKPADREAVIDILSNHPQFEERFQPPDGLTDDGSIERWQIGVAGCWPDIIRRSDYDRPTWHYQLGATMVIGDASAPDDPGSLPAGATLETQELYIGQATELCARVLA